MAARQPEAESLLRARGSCANGNRSQIGFCGRSVAVGAITDDHAGVRGRRSFSDGASVRPGFLHDKELSAKRRRREDGDSETGQQQARGEHAGNLPGSSDARDKLGQPQIQIKTEALKLGHAYCRFMCGQLGREAR
jgi:hypothetical protein